MDATDSPLHLTQALSGSLVSFSNTGLFRPQYLQHRVIDSVNVSSHLWTLESPCIHLQEIGGRTSNVRIECRFPQTNIQNHDAMVIGRRPNVGCRQKYVYTILLSQQEPPRPPPAPPLAITARPHVPSDTGPPRPLYSREISESVPEIGRVYSDALDVRIASRRQSAVAFS